MVIPWSEKKQIISTTLQSDLFSPTKTPRFCVVIGTRKVVRAHQKGNQWRRRSPIRRCPTMLQARWTKTAKKDKKPLGHFDIWDGFSKDWVWMVCNVCSLDGMWWVFSHSLFPAVYHPGDGTPVSSTHKRMSSTVHYKGASLVGMVGPLWSWDEG